MSGPPRPGSSTASALASRAGGVAAGLVLDQTIGERGLDPHPVAVFGSVMAAAERRWWDDDRAAGVRHALVGTALGIAAGAMLGNGPVAAAAAVWVTSGGRMLGDEATRVAHHLAAGDLPTARAALSALVGRDPSDLDEAEIARAVVESVAENTSDAAIGPAWWALCASAAGACGYRAVNTLDAMVGHRSPRHERFGWASARLDDAANWIPARATAALVAAVRPHRAVEVVRIVRRDAAAHPSPNAGVVESAFAAALGVRLGGSNRYGDRTEHRAALGDGRPPTAADIARAVRLSRHVTLAFAGFATLPGVVVVVRRLRRLAG
ncbi:MAG: cobalamin biosynthesis protein CobD [Acidimicrobiia bacterium]|nr:cobalamin biosynthesis protein CobD [Acidimicrobiia bacterium]